VPLIQVPIKQLSFSTQPAQLGDPRRYIPANQKAGEKLLAGCQSPGFCKSRAPGNVLTEEAKKLKKISIFISQEKQSSHMLGKRVHKLQFLS